MVIRGGNRNDGNRKCLFLDSVDTYLGTLTDSAAVTPLVCRSVSRLGQSAGEERAEGGAEVLGERVEVGQHFGVGVQADVHGAVIGGHRDPERLPCCQWNHRVERGQPGPGQRRRQVGHRHPG
jgi:hypothetical protein